MNRTDTKKWTICHELSYNKHFVSFKVYKVYGLDKKTNTYLWEDKRDNTGVSPTGNLKYAAVYLSGSIKWDGCANLYFDEQNDDTMLHFCGLNDALALAPLLREMYSIAHQEMGQVSSFDTDTALV